MSEAKKAEIDKLLDRLQKIVDKSKEAKLLSKLNVTVTIVAN